MTTDNDNWFKLPPTTSAGMLPPGDYQATIGSARVSRKTEAAWLMLDIFPDAAEGDVVSTVVCIAAKPGSRYVSNHARGRRMLAALMTATNAVNITSPADLPKHLSGRRLLVLAELIDSLRRKRAKQRLLIWEVAIDGGR